MKFTCGDTVTLIEAWSVWWAGESPQCLVLWGHSLLFWGRVGKVVQLASALFVVTDIVGPDRLRAMSASLHDGLYSRFFGTDRLRFFRLFAAIAFNLLLIGAVVWTASDIGIWVIPLVAVIGVAIWLAVAKGASAILLTVAIGTILWLISEMEIWIFLLVMACTLWLILAVRLWVNVRLVIQTEGPITDLQLLAPILLVDLTVLLPGLILDVIGVLLDWVLIRPLAWILEKDLVWAKVTALLLLLAGSQFDILAS